MDPQEIKDAIKKVESDVNIASFIIENPEPVTIVFMLVFGPWIFYGGTWLAWWYFKVLPWPVWGG